MTDIFYSLVFYLIALVIIASALGLVMEKNLVHSALLMTACFIGVGMLYIYLDAEFLGAAQFMLYSGGVAILAVMAVMLIKHGDEGPRDGGNGRALRAIAVASAFALVIGMIITALPYAPAGYISQDNVSELAEMMLTEYVLPFEIAAILLLSALIGAIILAKGDGEA